MPKAQGPADKARSVEMQLETEGGRATWLLPGSATRCPPEGQIPQARGGERCRAWDWSP